MAGWSLSVVAWGREGVEHLKIVRGRQKIGRQAFVLAHRMNDAECWCQRAEEDDRSGCETDFIRTDPAVVECEIGQDEKIEDRDEEEVPDPAREITCGRGVGGDASEVDRGRVIPIWSCRELRLCDRSGSPENPTLRPESHFPQ